MIWPKYNPKFYKSTTCRRKIKKLRKKILKRRQRRQSRQIVDKVSLGY